MAINPEISLGVRPPVIAPLQIQSPLEKFAKVQSLRNLMTQGQIGQLNIQQTQLENEALQEKQRRARAVADLFTGGTRPTEDQILGVGGPDAAAAIKGLHDADKARFDAFEATNKAITRTALGIKALPANERDFAYRAERSRLLSANPALTNQIPEQYQGDSWLDAKINQGLNADQYLSNVRADAKAKLEAPGIQADALTKQAESEQKQRMIEASALAPALARGAVAFQQALAGMDPKRAALYSGFQNPRDLLLFANTPHEQIMAQQAEATAAETATQHGVQNQIDRARLGIAQAELGLKQRGDTNDDELATTVIANPSLYDNLTPSAKTRIAPLLSKQGFTEFGKPMGEAAMVKIAESRSAIASLNDLRQTLKDNEQYIGPLAGFQAVNPYSEARQAQAKIDLVKQRVGKALEGGVLRKEDEEKYKKILATLYDTPATAIAKVDSLLTTIDRDIKVFENEQRRGGRNVPAQAASTAATPQGAAPKKAAPAAGTVKDGYRFLGGDPADPKNWRVAITVK